MPLSKHKRRSSKIIKKKNGSLEYSGELASGNRRKEFANESIKVGAPPLCHALSDVGVETAVVIISWTRGPPHSQETPPWSNLARTRLLGARVTLPLAVCSICVEDANGKVHYLLFIACHGAAYVPVLCLCLLCLSRSCRTRYWIFQFFFSERTIDYQLTKRTSSLFRRTSFFRKVILSTRNLAENDISWNKSYYNYSRLEKLILRKKVRLLNKLNQKLAFRSSISY